MEKGEIRAEEEIREGGRKIGRWQKKYGKIREIKPFVTIEPERYNAVKMAEGYEEVELAVDSGATETVIPEDTLLHVELKEGEAYKRGVTYEVANGIRIGNQGERQFIGIIEEGITRSLTAQVCEVNQGLLSVKKLIRAGNRVVFDEEHGSYIEDKQTGEKIWLEDRGGMFIMKMWVKTSKSGL